MTCRTGILALAALISMAACGREEIPGVQDVAEEMGLRIQVRSVGTASDGGDVCENRMDIAGGDFRIYFFTDDPALGGNDRFIAQFFPDSFDEISGGLFTDYSLAGRVPATLTACSDFKVMILANWGEAAYPLPFSGMTVDDVCSHGIFSCDSELIPFYGIREFSGVGFEAGKTTRLDGTVGMLRAMAKIEVVVEGEGLGFGSVVLHGVNGRGFCAPSGVYSAGDYSVRSDSGWHFLDDGLPLHLVGSGPDGNGLNDEDAASRTLEMRRSLDASGRELWYAYVPEYRNLSDGYSYIQVNLPGYEEDLEEYRIYFRTYREDGTAEPGADYDIARNTLYCFTVSMSGFYLNVRTEEWEDSFENDFTFD